MNQIGWVASYPRSGNTWMRFMLTSYLVNMPPASEERVDDLVPDFHKLTKGRRESWFDPTARSLFKIHYLPSAKIAESFTKPVSWKVLYLVRDPRDVMISVARQVGIVPSPDDRPRRWA
jgi:hypothetical protein